MKMWWKNVVTKFEKMLWNRFLKILNFSSREIFSIFCELQKSQNFAREQKFKFIKKPPQNIFFTSSSQHFWSNFRFFKFFKALFSIFQISILFLKKFKKRTWLLLCRSDVSGYLFCFDLICLNLCSDDFFCVFFNIFRVFVNFCFCFSIFFGGDDAMGLMFFC